MRTASSRWSHRSRPSSCRAREKDGAGRIDQKYQNQFDESQSAEDFVIAHIANQEFHHRKMTFREEFRAILEKHGVAFDEHYVWD
ncbi:MAG TPA: hypothetical protein VE242_08615 [Chthoniobacterales bacterium]|nr:hypothetical protein [Chthoniobacterales bacterium]